MELQLSQARAGLAPSLAQRHSRVAVAARRSMVVRAGLGEDLINKLTVRPAGGGSGLAPAAAPAPASRPVLCLSCCNLPPCSSADASLRLLMICTQLQVAIKNSPLNQGKVALAVSQVGAKPADPRLRW